MWHVTICLFRNTGFQKFVKCDEDLITGIHKILTMSYDCIKCFFGIYFHGKTHIVFLNIYYITADCAMILINIHNIQLYSLHTTIQPTHCNTAYTKLYSLYTPIQPIHSYTAYTQQYSVHTTIQPICNLAWVNSLNNICFKHRLDESSQTRQFRGLNIDGENRILWFAPHTFIFS